MTDVEGRPVIFSGDGGTIRRYDAATGDPVGYPLTGHTEAVLALAVTDVEGRPVIFSGDGGTIRRYDAATGDPAGEPLTGLTAPAWAGDTSLLNACECSSRIASADRTTRVHHP